MASRKIYRGEFSNTLENPDTQLPVDQVVRIDISDTASGSTDASSVIAKFTSATNLLLVDSDGHSTYEELSAFFFNGQHLRIEGDGALNGDWIVSDVHLTPPTDLTTGKVHFIINIPSPPGSEVATDVTFTNIPDEPTIIPIEMAGDPLHISTIDNDEDKFTPIRSKQAEIKIHTIDGIGLNTFCEGEDNQFMVEIYVNMLIIFRGFLMIPDMQQEFLPDPNILTLTATDGLANLKDIALVKPDGTTPQFDWRLSDYIAWSLRGTKIIYPFNVINSLRHGTGSFTISGSFVASNRQIAISDTYASKFYNGMAIAISGTNSNNGNYTVVAVTIVNILGFDFAIISVAESLVDEADTDITFQDLSSLNHFHEEVYLDAKTFESTVGKCDNMYNVLLTILGEDSVCFQLNGEFYILRVDEIEPQAYTVTRYDVDGNFVSDTDIDKVKSIGINEVMAFMDDNSVIIPDRAYKHVKETFKYQSWEEMLCNIAFLRDTLIGDLPDEVYPPNDPGHDPPIVGQVYNVKNYTPECWTLIKGITTPYSTLDTTGYIKVYSQFNYEKSRALAILQAPVDAFYQWRNDVKIPMNQGDKFTVDCSFRYTNGLTGTGHFQIATFYIRLYGSDGSFWTLFSTTDSTRSPKWVACSSAFPTVDQQLCFYDDLNGDNTDYRYWQNCSIDSAPLPVAGHLEFSLVDSFQSNSGDKLFQGLRIDYSPLINGSYQRYTGQFNQVEQDGGYVAIRDKEVKMSDSPSLILKGAMKIFNGVDYILTYGFTDRHWTDPTPYGKIQVFAVWNQYHRSNRNFDATVDKLESESVQSGVYNGLDLIHRILLTDSNDNTNNRLFWQLHYDQDFYLLENKAYVVSLYKTDEGKKYDDIYSFGYTTQL